MKTICFIAQFPPPIHGLSKAVDTLYNSKLKSLYNLQKIDIKNNKDILKTLFKVCTSEANLFYFTISQSVKGNIRDLLLLFILRLRKKNCIVHLHGGYFRQLLEHDCNKVQKIINYRLLKTVKCAIVLSKSLIKIFDGIVKKINVVGNCVDNQFFQHSYNFEKAHQGKLQIVYLSNFIKEKGYRETLQVALTLKKMGYENNFVFHFAGAFFQQEEKNFFSKYVKNNALYNVEYWGIVDGKDKKTLLEKGNVFFLLTNYPKEGQPISILEAMANGMTIVTTNHAGIPDIVGDENGLVCDVNNIDINTIAAYLVKCYQDRDYLNKIGLFNYKFVETYFSESTYIDNMISIFDNFV